MPHDDLTIVYEDHSLLLCVKPGGVLSEDSENGASMPHLLRQHYAAAHQPDYIATVHRLDKVTGGLMLFSRQRAVTGRLNAAVAEHRVEKEYLAVLRGHPPEKEGELIDLLFRDAAKNKSYVVKRMRGGVKQAKLHYEILARQDGLSLVRIRLETGRTHQIRVQFASRGLPLLGDGKYGRHLCALVLPAFLPGRKGRSRLRGPAPGPVPVDGVFLIRCTVQSFRQIRTVFSRLTARTSRRAAA